jgi:DNA-binding LacI/PurR family transcriptional regulator
VAEEVAQGTLKAARLVGADVSRDVALATAKNRPGGSALWNVMQTVRQEVRHIVRSGAWPDAELRDV